MEQSKKKAVIYCRVSTKEQVEEGNSLATQEKLCREFALKNGYEVIEVFVEQGESAKTAERTELKKLLSYCALKKDRISAVIAYKLDRISRNTDDYSAIRIALKRCDVEIKSTSEYFENSPAGRFMENIIANVAQFDNDVRTERSIGGMREAVREGRYVWTAPIGYQNLKIAGKANIAPDSMAPLVQKTFKEVGKNLEPVEEVRRRMLREGLTNKQGKGLSRSYFYTMLRNELYEGTIIKFGERHKGIFQPLISEELFEQVQRVLRYRRRRTTQYDVENPDFPLRRFIFHPEGAKLTGCWCKGRQKLYPYYRFHEPKSLFRKESLETAFGQFLDSFELNEQYLQLFRTKIKPAFLKAVRKENEQHTATQKSIADLKEKQGKLIQKNLEGYISNQVLQTQLELIDVALRDSYALLTSSSEAVKNEQTLEGMFDFAESFLRKPSIAWQGAAFKEKIKLQWFAFPKGVLFNGVNCQTTEICFLFKLKSLIEPLVSFRVHSNNTTTNNPEIPTDVQVDEMCREIRTISGLMQEVNCLDSS